MSKNDQFTSVTPLFLITPRYALPDTLNVEASLRALDVDGYLNSVGRG